MPSNKFAFCQLLTALLKTFGALAPPTHQAHDVYSSPVLPLRWRCVECMIHHKRDVREEQQYIYVAQTSNNRVIVARELCCLLQPCEALRTCRSGFPIATPVAISYDRVNIVVGSDVEMDRKLLVGQDNNDFLFAFS